MAEKQVEAAYKAILDDIGGKLKDEGYSKRGAAWRKLQDGNVAIVEAQRSQESTSQAIRFTFNIGIISAKLLHDWQPAASKASAHDAHLRQRIGEFLDSPDDKWWTVRTENEAASIAAEAAVMLDRALPYLTRHTSDSGLVALWEQGESPGLTEGQRQRNLAELKGISIP